MTVVYALLIGAPLALLLWTRRRKGTMMLIALAALYCPGAWMVLHPRAAGFTVLAFSALVALIATAWLTSPPVMEGRRRLIWITVGVVALFALWANLHGGFIGGLLLIVLVAVGLALRPLARTPGGGRAGVSCSCSSCSGWWRRQRSR